MERADGWLQVLRRVLLLIVLFGMAGTLTELFLLEHTESRTQWIPIVSLSAGLLCTGAALARPAHGTLRAVQAVMLVFVVAGFAGVYFHMAGNLGFEQEVHPENTGWTLWREALFGATPLLAPGAMVQLGLTGLAATWRHPHLEEERQ